MMTECRCKKCKKKFAVKRGNVRYNISEQGYKYMKEEYFLECPHCQERQEVPLTELPFRVRLQLFRDICLK